MSKADSIQAVINTIDRLEFKATADQAGMILGIHRILSQVRDELRAEEAGENGRETDAE